MRYFLLDRVTEIVPGVSAEGVKNVTLTDEVLHDHFPDFPILPGALVVEAMAQLAGFLVEITMNEDGRPILRALLAQIRRAKFSRPAEPGDQLVLTARLGARLDAAAEASVEARVGRDRVARAELQFVLREVPSERVHAQRRRLYQLWTRGLTTPVRIP